MIVWRPKCKAILGLHERIPTQKQASNSGCSIYLCLGVPRHTQQTRSPNTPSFIHFSEDQGRGFDPKSQA